MENSGQADLTTHVVCWTPLRWPNGSREETRGEIAIYPLGNLQCKRFAMSDGACWVDVRSSSFEKRQAVALSIFQKAVMDGIDPGIVTDTLMELAEFQADLGLEAH